MKKKIIIGLNQDWTDLFKCIFVLKGKFTFINFHFLIFEIEIDKVVGGTEIYIGLLGFWIYIGLNKNI